VLRGTQEPPACSPLRVRDSHPLRSGFPAASTSLPSGALESCNPGQLVDRFGLFRFRSPLLAESSLFLGLLRCFSSSGSPPVSRMTGYHPCRVSPFGYLRLLAAAHASSELFAVYHVLRRHLTPRHPPYALFRFSYVIRRDRSSRLSPHCRRFVYALLSVCGW
jgi:hypothetical protein